MKSCILVVRFYNRGQGSLFLQWILKNFHLNGLNLDNENYGNYWIFFLLNILVFFYFIFGCKGMMMNLKIWNFEDDI